MSLRCYQATQLWTQVGHPNYTAGLLRRIENMIQSPGRKKAFYMRTVFLSASFLVAAIAGAQAQPQPNLMPSPASVQLGSGHLLIDQSFSVIRTGYRDSILDNGIQRFIAQLSHQTGMRLMALGQDSHATLTIHAEHGSEPVEKLGEEESYELRITDSAAKLSAPNTLGILHGLQTFLQLVQTGGDGFFAPAVTLKINLASLGVAC